MTVAYTGSIGGYGLASSTLNIGSLTVSGPLPYVLVAVGTGGTTDATTSVTINGTSMGSPLSPFPVTNNNGCTVFGLAGATTGPIIITVSSSRNITVAAAAFSGVNASTPTGTVAEAGYSSTTSFSSGSITGVDSTGLFVCGLSERYNQTVSAENGSPTLIIAETDGGASGTTRLVYQTGAASYTYSGTITSSSGVVWGVYINAGAVVIPVLLGQACF